MKIIRPFLIDTASLVSTSVAETVAVWDGAVTYALAANVLDNTNHRIFESLQASNLNHPLTDPLWWLDIGPSNPWAMFDQINGTLTTITGPLDFKVAVTGRADSVALLNLTGVSSVRIKVLAQSTLFETGQQGVWYDPSDLTTLSQDSAGTTPVTTSSQPVGKMLDLSGNGNHASQATAAARPTYQVTPERITIDRVDDRLITTVPAGGFVGTMVLGTDAGTASYGVNIPAGDYDIGGRGGLYFPGTAIIGQFIRNVALSAGEAAGVEAEFVARGATAGYGAITNFANYWRSWTEITSFPLINTSAGTNFRRAWSSCTSLTSFPASTFDAINGGDFTDAFTNTALTQTSIDNILVSLVASGIAAGTRVFGQSGGSAPSATGEAAITTLRSRGWTVTVTGGF